MSDLTTEPYRAMSHFDADDQVTCGYRCNICGRPVDDTNGACPDHTPLEYPGLQLAECGAEPRHAYTWFLDDDGYGAPCMYCVYEAVRDAHAGCEHSHHGPWRRWKVTHRLAGWAYTLGITSASSYRYDGNCSGCYTPYFHGRRLYVLGLSRGAWRCLLRGRHLPGEPTGVFDYCGKCLPWPCCGSKRVEHAPKCTEGDE
jgi:hypothetical protein